jgi:hypothetical protein
MIKKVYFNYFYDVKLYFISNVNVYELKNDIVKRYIRAI